MKPVETKVVRDERATQTLMVTGVDLDTILPILINAYIASGRDAESIPRDEDEKERKSIEMWVGPIQILACTDSEGRGISIVVHANHNLGESYEPEFKQVLSDVKYGLWELSQK